MLIQLSKFGTTLTSRDSGKEAYSAIQPLLSELSINDELILNFDGVNTFSPSWADEFLTPLHKKYGERLVLQPTQNLSVKTTLNLLAEINKINFIVR